MESLILVHNAATLGDLSKKASEFDTPESVNAYLQVGKGMGSWE